MLALQKSIFPPGSLFISNKTKGTVVCRQGSLANNFRTRLCGLLGRSGLHGEGGLLIQPSSGVHTIGMSFAIDIVVLDGEQRVIALSENTGGWAVRGVSLKTRSVLELPPGRIHECLIEVGDHLIVHGQTKGSKVKKRRRLTPRSSALKECLSKKQVE